MPAAKTVPSKTCAVCGREITWRKAWAKNWDEVRYCSDACRRRKRGVGRADAGDPTEAAVRTLLQTRANGATACPSEVARGLSADDWRPLMEPVREAARRMAARGEVEWLQGGRVVDPSRARGPVRLRLVQNEARQHDSRQRDPADPGDTPNDGGTR